DPHSGNLKIVDDKIVWLDFGMMGELTRGQAQQMSEALDALAQRDLPRLCDAILNIGIPPEDLDYIGFSNALETYLNRYINQSFSDLDLGVMVTEAIEICQRYSIRLPSSITMLARSMVTIQGTLKDLDDQVNMLEYISSEGKTLDQIDWNKEISTFLKESYAGLKALTHMPVRLDRTLSLLQKGRLQVGIKISDLDHLMPQISHLVDRLVVCILIAALLMGSSIICTTGMKPQLLGIPVLGLAGFFISFCLSLWLFYKMLFNRKNGNRLF
ncbi:AarF/UbiB family protein, partial [uncultured Allobaculum sp.]